MLDKMKALMDMQRKMQELKRELDNALFEIEDSQGLVKVVMNGSQEIKEVQLLKEINTLERVQLEKAVKEAYNKAIKRSQEAAAGKMKEITGFNIPGLG
ncbi:MAG TPA: YbaB/EbfC family nucleoid-associated protein [Candidatus Margulisiibacteriota bacterium]|nr:YbaB/EbfC family nucleoid-associated protein [Candidatus Margulisiibacteriota bacterium]